MTAREFVTRAYRRANIITPVDPLEAEELRDGFSLLQEVSEAMVIERQMIPAVRRHLFNLVANTASYTIGTGATFNVPRPTWLEGVGVVYDSTAATPLEKNIGPALTATQYQNVPAKSATSSYPNRCYYDHAFAAATGFGTVYPFPITTRSNVQLALYLPASFTQFTDFSDDVSFPPGYSEHIVLQTALKAIDYYNRQAPQGMQAAAVRAQSRIKRANFRPQDARFPLGLGGRRGRFDIYGGG